jgi:hypothetical protein
MEEDRAAAASRRVAPRYEKSTRNYLALAHLAAALLWLSQRHRRRSHRRHLWTASSQCAGRRAISTLFPVVQEKTAHDFTKEKFASEMR